LIIYCNAQISPLFSNKILFTKSQIEISAQKSKIVEMAYFTHFPSQISMVWPGLQWLSACSHAENVCFALYDMRYLSFKLLINAPKMVRVKCQMTKLNREGSQRSPVLIDQRSPVTSAWRISSGFVDILSINLRTTVAATVSNHPTVRSSPLPLIDFARFRFGRARCTRVSTRQMLESESDEGQMQIRATRCALNLN
jgi:hypothetical protein